MQSIGWNDPLDVAAAINSTDMVLLYSGTQTSYSGRYSYLAYDLKEKVIADNFAALAGKLSRDKNWYENAWFGYFGYDLKNSLERLPPESTRSYIRLPDLCMMRFGTILRFDHETKRVDGWSENAITAAFSTVHSAPLPTVKHLCSNMSNTHYLEKVANIIDAIHNGDLYQANLTRKFFGEFTTPVHGLSLFHALCSASPAPYSAFIRMGNVSICSSSPELFLRISSDGNIETRPIKGTSPRMPDAAEDRKSFEKLAASEKDKAENLMITDLMRNDLAHTCIPGSITVKDMFSVTSHSNVHHMASTVRGVRQENKSTLDVIRNCFPPGSMTGAPKIKAMKLCSELEGMARGVYAGAIGFIDGAGAAELSVVIRTIITNDKAFEFQAGGGIVADSIPEAEMQETFDKVRGIMNTLNMPLEMLKNL